jgi:hypothetical protein
LRVGNPSTYLQSTANIDNSTHAHYIAIAQCSNFPSPQYCAIVSFSPSVTNPNQTGIWYGTIAAGNPWKIKTFPVVSNGVARFNESIANTAGADLTTAPATATLDFYGVSAYSQKVGAGNYTANQIHIFSRGIARPGGQGNVSPRPASSGGGTVFLGVVCGAVPVYNPVHIFRLIGLRQDATIEDLAPLRVAIENWLMFSRDSPYYAL